MGDTQRTSQPPMLGNSAGQLRVEPVEGRTEAVQDPCVLVGWQLSYRWHFPASLAVMGRQMIGTDQGDKCECHTCPWEPRPKPSPSVASTSFLSHPVSCCLELACEGWSPWPQDDRIGVLQALSPEAETLDCAWAAHRALSHGESLWM